MYLSLSSLKQQKILILLQGNSRRSMFVWKYLYVLRNSSQDICWNSFNIPIPENGADFYL